MGKFSRDKGKRAEQWTVQQFRRVFPDTKRTGWMQSEEKAAPGANADFTDVPDVVAGPFDIEVKAKKAHNVWQTMKQAQDQARKGQVPICVLKRRPSEDNLVVMELGDFLDFCREWKKETEQ